MSTMHTPTPWEAEPMVGRGAWIKGGGGEWAALSCGDADSTARANAAFIVTAVNNHEALMLELDMKEGDLVMLRQAVEAGDPRNELLIRINDMLRSTRELRVKASTP